MRQIIRNVYIRHTFDRNKIILTCAEVSQIPETDVEEEVAKFCCKQTWLRLTWRGDLLSVFFYISIFII